MSEYINWEYGELRKECAKRGLGGKGKKEDLINKLVNDDLGHAPEPEPEPEPLPDRFKGLKASDPNPDNPNWDMAGRWIRR